MICQVFFSFFFPFIFSFYFSISFRFFFFRLSFARYKHDTNNTQMIYNNNTSSSTKKIIISKPNSLMFNEIWLSSIKLYWLWRWKLAWLVAASLIAILLLQISFIDEIYRRLSQITHRLLKQHQQGNTLTDLYT